jgi:hypothetical protein
LLRALCSTSTSASISSTAFEQGTDHSPHDVADFRWRFWKFLKTHSYQRILKDEAATRVGEYGARLCMREGFVGHAEKCNIRVRRCGGKNVADGTAAK